MTREEAIKIIDCYDIGFYDLSGEKISADKLADAFDMAIEALQTDAIPQLKQTDTLIIADALRYLAKDTERHLVDRTRADSLRQQFLKYGASMCKGGGDE